MSNKASKIETPTHFAVAVTVMKAEWNFVVQTTAKIKELLEQVNGNIDELLITPEAVGTQFKPLNQAQLLQVMLGKTVTGFQTHIYGTDY